MNEALRQQKEALDELRKLWLVLIRLKRLLREEATYSGPALEESANSILGEVSHHLRRVAARTSILVALRNGRVYGIKPEQE
jgi:hypothetical protein